MKPIFTQTLIMFLLSMQQLLAQKDTDSLVTYEFKDSIVVVANRYKAALKSIAYSYQVIQKEQIQSMSNHSALEMVDFNVPSSFIFEKKVLGFGVGSSGSGQVYLRGLGGQPNSGVLVLLNGHPDFMGIFGHPLPDVYGVDDIQQVEILAGPASTVFGNHALGGVVNLVTESDYQHLAKISLEGGAYHSYNIGLNLSKNFGRQGLFLNARRKKTDGHIEKSSFESVQLNAGYSLQLKPSLSLSVQARYVPYRFDDPSRGPSDPAELGTYGKIERGTAEVIVRNNLTRLQGSLQIYTNYGHHQFFDGFESNDFSYGLSLYQNWLAGSNYSFAFGTDLMQFGGQAENKFAFLPNGKPLVKDKKHEITSSGTYALGFYNPFQFLDLKAGIRYQYNSVYNSNWAPVAGLTLHVLPDLKIYSNYQNGFRNPTAMELYLFPTANPQLQAEEVNSIEIGAMYQFGLNRSFQMAYFQNRARNLIQVVPNPTPPPLTQFANSGEADQWGFESQFKWQMNRHLGAQFSYSYLDPDFLTAFNPVNQFKYIFTASDRNYRLNIFGKYVSDFFASNHSTMKLPDYHILNVSITIINSTHDVYLKVMNILNRKYRILPNYPAPGTNARLGIDIKF